MRFLSIPTLLAFSPVKVYQSVDTKSRWVTILTNTGVEPQTSRLSGRLEVTDRNGKLIDEHKLPLGGFSLKPSESCMSHTPLPEYRDLVRMTFYLKFLDIEQEDYIGSILHFDSGCSDQ